MQNGFSSLVAPTSIVIGGALGSAIETSPEFSAFVINGTAGLITYTWAMDILPSVARYEPVSPRWQNQLWAKQVAAIGGMVVGLASMLAVRKYDSLVPVVRRAVRKKVPNSLVIDYPLSIVISASIEIFIDALLLGMHRGFADVRQSSSITQTAVNGLLAWIVAYDLRKHRVPDLQRFLTIGGLAALSVFGSAAGLLGSRWLREEDVFFKGLMGFATVVIAWLVIEDLLPLARKRLGKRTNIAGEAIPYFGGLAAGVVCCRATIVQDKTFGTVIELSGDQRQSIAKDLVEQGIAAADQMIIHGF